jgi:hypothetical protein
MNKSDDPAMIFFKPAFFRDKGSSSAEGVSHEFMVLHLYMPFRFLPFLDQRTII